MLIPAVVSVGAVVLIFALLFLFMERAPRAHAVESSRPERELHDLLRLAALSPLSKRETLGRPPTTPHPNPIERAPRR